MSLSYSHVDVFSSKAYGGNSLPVFTAAEGLNKHQMLQITKELRQFEAIFIEKITEHKVKARVFDLFSELPFAGHPVIGAAAVLHHELVAAESANWQFELAEKLAAVRTTRVAEGYVSLMDQGQPSFLNTVSDRQLIAAGFDLTETQLDPQLPLEVVSTGLSYLIIPVLPGVLGQARIKNDITQLLHQYDAQYAVLLDNANMEIRHWNNDGVVEDTATGSAAGTIGAYRLRNGLATAGNTFTLTQGQFVGRLSELRVCPKGTPDEVCNVLVGGNVAMVGRGSLEHIP